jgi:anthranilate phosphoribosyltransferase
MLVGCSVAALGPTLAETFRLRGIERAMVVHSLDGLDEISPSAPTRAWLVERGQVTEREIGPADFGLPAHALQDVHGGDAEENGRTMRRVLDGEPGPMLDFVLMNAAAALYVAGADEDFRSGVERARDAVVSRRARDVLAAYIRLSQAAANE